MNTVNDFLEFFKQHGIKADIRDDGNYAIIVITDETVPDDVKYALEIHRPVGMGIHYTLRSKNKMPIPAVLAKWYKETAKEMK